MGKTNDEVQALVEQLEAYGDTDKAFGYVIRAECTYEAAAMLTALSAEVEALKAEARSKALDYLALDGQAMELEKFKADTVAEIAILKASCTGYQMDIEELQGELAEALKVAESYRDAAHDWLVNEEANPKGEGYCCLKTAANIVGGIRAFVAKHKGEGDEQDL